jgi:hypothetical protein
MCSDSFVTAAMKSRIAVHGTGGSRLCRIGAKSLNASSTRYAPNFLRNTLR